LPDALAGLKYLEFDKETILTDEYTAKNSVLFFLKGNFVIDCNRFANRQFMAGEMVLVAKSSPLRITVEAYSQMLVLSFDALNNISGYDQLLALRPLCKEIIYNFTPMPIQLPLNNLLNISIHCLKNNMGEQSLYDMVLYNFLFLLKVYYTREEIVKLLYPIMGKEPDFKDFVMQNYTKVGSLSELIERSSQCRTTFLGKFKEEFGTTAKQWLNDQLRQRILWKIREPGVRVKELIAECNFESRAQFYRFFKQQFNCTPKELIRHSQTSSDRRAAV
jgi:AraC-like DNA-binding protein